jgi:hypothetical protein
MGGSRPGPGKTRWPDLLLTKWIFLHLLLHSSLRRFDASWTEHPDLSAVQSQFSVKRPRKTDLGELCGTANRFARKSIDDMRIVACRCSSITGTV